MPGTKTSLISCLVFLCLTGVSFQQTTSAANISSLPWCDSGSTVTTVIVTTASNNNATTANQNGTTNGAASGGVSTNGTMTSRAATSTNPVTTSRSGTASNPVTTSGSGATNNNGGNSNGASTGASNSSSGSVTTSSGSGSGTGSGSVTTSSGSGSGSGSGGSGSTVFNLFIKIRRLLRFKKILIVVGRVLSVDGVEIAAFENRVKSIVGSDAIVEVEKIGTDTFGTSISLSVNTNSSSSFSLENRVDKIVSDLKSNEATLKATLPSTLLLSLDSSALEVTANETLIVNGVKKINSCTKSANSNSIDCQKGTVNANGSVTVESTSKLSVSSISLKSTANIFSMLIVVLSVVYFNMGF